MADTEQLDYARHYRNWHDDSDEHFEAEAEGTAKFLARFLPTNRDAAILEIGPGMGFAQGAMRKLGYKNFSGMDSDRSQAEASQRRGLPVALVPVSETLAYLEARKGTLDMVFAIDVLEHIPVPVQISFLRAVKGALKPGGKFVCQVPNASSPLASHYRFVDWTHTCSFTKTSLDFVLYSAGFRTIDIAEATPNRLRPSFRLWAVRALVRRAHRIALTSDIGWREAKNLPMSANIIASAQ